jgi:myo-inositol-1(or 4)-monophosphatase
MTLDEVCQAAREAGKIMLNADGDKQVRQKSSRRDLVTKYDAAVQAFLQERLSAIAPEAGFLGEESVGGGGRPHAENRFIVDPIDGTANFIKGLRRSCVSIGYEQAGEIVLGVIYNPYAGELFSAEKGKGAFLNGAPIHVSGAPLDEAMAFAGTSPYYADCLDETLLLAKRLLTRCLDIRRSGSAALELCDVAAGRAEVYYEYRLSPWDYAAGSCILQEAGGRISDLAGGPLPFDRKSSMAAGNPACWRELIRLAAEVKGTGK